MDDMALKDLVPQFGKFTRREVRVMKRRIILRFHNNCGEGTDAVG